MTEDYGFLQRINLWPPFVTIGIYCSSLSAAMCAMIGASRILHALAVDQLFGEALTDSYRRASVHEFVLLDIFLFLAGLPLAPAAITSSSGNPWVAVLYTWGLAQVAHSLQWSLVYNFCLTGLDCGGCGICVSVCGVCGAAQRHRKPGDCFLLASLRCSRSSLFGSRVGVSSKFQVRKIQFSQKGMNTPLM